MRLLVLAAMVVLLSGCTGSPAPARQADTETSSAPADAFAEAQERVARAAKELGLLDVQVLAWEAVELGTTGPVSVAFTVPYALRMTVLWQSDQGAYDGPVKWTGVGDCDGTGGAGGPTAVLGRNGGSASVSCAPPTPGTHELTADLAVGRVSGTFIVLAVIPAPPEPDDGARSNVTQQPPGP